MKKFIYSILITSIFALINCTAKYDLVVKHPTSSISVYGEKYQGLYKSLGFVQFYEKEFSFYSLGTKHVNNMRPQAAGGDNVAVCGFLCFGFGVVGGGGVVNTNDLFYHGRDGVGILDENISLMGNDITDRLKTKLVAKVKEVGGTGVANLKYSIHTVPVFIPFAIGPFAQTYYYINAEIVSDGVTSSAVPVPTTTPAKKGK